MSFVKLSSKGRKNYLYANVHFKKANIIVTNYTKKSLLKIGWMSDFILIKFRNRIWRKFKKKMPKKFELPLPRLLTNFCAFLMLQWSLQESDVINGRPLTRVGVVSKHLPNSMVSEKPSRRIGRIQPIGAHGQHAASAEYVGCKSGRNLK